MSEQYPGDEKEKNTPPPPGNHRYSWVAVWSIVLSRPATDTFEQLLTDPGANSNRAVKWIFTGSFVLFLLSIITTTGQISLLVDLQFLLSGILIAIVSTIGFVLTTVFIQGCARLAGGKGSIEHFQYAYAAFDMPLRFIQYLVLIVAPQSPIFVTVLMLYRLLLLGMALRAVHNFTWGKAIYALVLSIIMLSAFFLLLALLFFFIFNNISSTPLI